MAIPKKRFTELIRDFDFRTLFNELGWNNDSYREQITVNQENYAVESVAEKSGFRILVCEPQSCSKIPLYPIRRKIETEIAKYFFEHIIIFIDEVRIEQVWQFTHRKIGHPARTSEIRYHIDQAPERLYQRTGGIFFTLDEEERITIVDVTMRVAENFQKNAEEVTKKFYDRFNKEHYAFQNFISGIEEKGTIDWYTSLMLNRLMFCYFIQKKGFLNNDNNYLKNKLQECRMYKGANSFYSFYRSFLLALFHKGLGTPQKMREELSHPVKLGKIPYLNGGIFQEHEIEKDNPDLDISDEAFEKIFDFFDEYDWHLDARPEATGKEINPDVVGYIFEKYINERAKMGAYYTKEDITDYIGKNCIIPWLFDEVKKSYPASLNKNGLVWKHLQDSGDRYIYRPMKHGIPANEDIFEDLPENIKRGFIPELEQKIVDGKSLLLWEIRKLWNEEAPSEISLDTETYRELISRRKRYQEIKSKITAGEINQINDLITYNLDIRQFAQDVIETTEDANFIRHFYKALTKITILDPTCGSGAFLFAAMNILEPLYAACIERMSIFQEELGKRKHVFFDKVLEEVNAPEHPNVQYFIFKSIILNNIYGVDIMRKAVEIAKLRLFLKLVSTVDVNHQQRNYGLEPLPDIDFNIRAGNTLVGYATQQDFYEAFEGDLDYDDDKGRITTLCKVIGKTFDRYKKIQLQGYNNFVEMKKAKDELYNRLKELRDELNEILYKHYYTSYGDYDKWLDTHQPFHWFAEFFDIIENNQGFDVIIGNPPYVEYSRVEDQYTVINYKTQCCNNLYAFVFERCFSVSKGSVGLIVQLSAISTQGMKPLRDFIRDNADLIYYGAYPERPKQLFEEACIALSIIICHRNSGTKRLVSSGTRRSSASSRSTLFEVLKYTDVESFGMDGFDLFPKFTFPTEMAIYNKIKTNTQIIKYLALRYDEVNSIYYRSAGGRYWKIILSRDFSRITSANRTLSFKPEHSKHMFCSLFNSNLFWWYYSACSDLYNLPLYILKSFPFIYNDSIEGELIRLGQVLMESFEENKSTGQQYIKTRETLVKFETFAPHLSKPIIDEIDSILAQHYGFTQEELDFIINYDNRYRMTGGNVVKDEQQELDL